MVNMTERNAEEIFGAALAMDTEEGIAEFWKKWVASIIKTPYFNSESRQQQRTVRTLTRVDDSTHPNDTLRTGVGPDGKKLREGEELEAFLEKMSAGYFQGMFFYDWIIMRTACQVAKDLMEGDGELGGGGGGGGKVRRREEMG